MTILKKASGLNASFVPLLISLCLARAENATEHSTQHELSALREQLRLMQQKITLLEKKIQQLETKKSDPTKPTPPPFPKNIAQQQAAASTPASPESEKLPSFAFGERGLVIEDPRTASRAQIGVLMQYDIRTRLSSESDDGLAPPLAGQYNTFDMRRLLPTFRGTLYDKLEFRFTAEFAGTARMLEAYMDYNIFEKLLTLRLGNTKTPVVLELQQSISNIWFNESAFPNEFSPARDIGIMLMSELFDGAAELKFGMFNGAPDGFNGALATDTNDGFDIVGSILLKPFQNFDITALEGLVIGFAASYGEQNRPASFRLRNMSRLDVVRDNTLLEKGAAYRLNPSAQYFYGPFGFMGEYVLSARPLATTRVPEQDRSFLTYQNEAWNMQASFMLTGEKATYGRISPKRPLDPAAGNWGAWQLVGRYTALRVDRDMFEDGLLLLDANNPHGNAQRADSWSLGLNWYPTRYLRAMFSFNQTFYGGYGGGRQTDNFLLARFQLDF
jgi:phosphate-selective porin OprO/OprP